MGREDGAVKGNGHNLSVWMEVVIGYGRRMRF